MMDSIDPKLIAESVLPVPIKCEPPESCKDFVNSGLALEVATENVNRHVEMVVRYEALRDFSIKLVEDYNRIATEHNQKVEKVK